MYTLRSRMRSSISALLAAVILAAVFAPIAPTSQVSAAESRVMATDQVYVRSGPSTADTILGELHAGDWVSTTGGFENNFTEIWYGDWIGYVYADYLALDGTPLVPDTNTESQPDTGVTWIGDSWMYTSDSVNLRSGASTSDGIIAVLPGGTSVYHTGAMSNGFYQVDTDYGFGWVHADYLGANAPAPEPAPQVTTQGQAIVNFAMQFHGYPYVWAGNTPGGGFDCSGLTQYVVQNVLGYDITHSTDIQATYGTSVAWGQWQPGDLIFFVGTGGGGYISHVGIYIGDGQMIHAENPGTGVVISSLYSSYYSNHYYSATRLN